MKNTKNPYHIKCQNIETEWQKIPVKGDGNCFFRSVSLLLFQSETHHLAIRSGVVRFICDHVDKFSSMVDGNIYKHIEHISRSSGGSEIWATESEIKATCDM